MTVQKMLEEAIKLLYDAFDFGTIDDEEYVK